MTASPASFRPAIAPAVVILIGIALSSPWAPASALATMAVIAAAGSFITRTAIVRRTFFLLALLTAGGASGALALQRAAERAAGWLPADGSTIEADLIGIVLRAPERDRRGEFCLRVAARPRPDPSPDAESATLRLVVRAGPSTGGVQALRRGDRIRAFARVRAPSGTGATVGEDLASLAWGIDGVGSIKSARLVEKLADGDLGPGRFIDFVLVAARRRLDLALGENDDARNTAAAMVLGDRSGIEPDAMRALRDSGLFHLLAISGLNVALLVGAAFVILRRLRLASWLKLALVIAALWSFGALVGADPPVTRACAGTALALLGRTIGRDGDSLNTLAVIVGVLALLDPASLFHPGFQLTFAAAAGLIAGARPIAAALPGPRLMAGALGASVAAYAATAPILAWHFGKLAPVGLLSNLAAGPLCGAILGSSFAVLAAAETPILGPWCAAALRAATGMLDGLSVASANVPLATVRVAKPSPLLIVTVVAVLVLAWALSHGRRGGGARGRWARATAAAGVLALHLGPAPRAPGVVRVAVIDVGQGQAVALQSSGGQCLLFDGGGSGGGRFDAGERIVAPWLAAWNCRRLHAVIVSHAHDDHVGGLASILREFDVGALWIGTGSWSDEATPALATLARERDAAVVLASAGATIAIDDLWISILHPGAPDSALAINDRCVVVRIVTARGASLLVPGDLERTGENRLLDRGYALASDALVAGHHGAARSSSDEWLLAVRPSLALVSAGQGNRFGHPAPATLERLRRQGATTYRTDRAGTIVLLEELGEWRIEGGALRGATGRARE